MSGELALRVDLLARLEESGWLTPTGLRIDDPSLSFERYEAVGRLLGRAAAALRWAVGDWLLYGEELYGESAAQASEALGISPEGRLELIRVARAIPFSRRRQGLGWGTHRAVAARWIEPAKREELLERAEREQWKTRQMEEAVRELKAANPSREVSPGCEALVENTASELRRRLRSCGFDGELAISIEVSAPGVSYLVRTP